LWLLDVILFISGLVSVGTATTVRAWSLLKLILGGEGPSLVQAFRALDASSLPIPSPPVETWAKGIQEALRVSELHDWQYHTLHHCVCSNVERFLVLAIQVLSIWREGQALGLWECLSETIVPWTTKDNEDKGDRLRSSSLEVLLELRIVLALLAEEARDREVVYQLVGQSAIDRLVELSIVLVKALQVVRSLKPHLMRW